MGTCASRPSVVSGAPTTKVLFSAIRAARLRCSLTSRVHRSVCGPCILRPVVLPSLLPGRSTAVPGTMVQRCNGCAVQSTGHQASAHMLLTCRTSAPE